MHGIFPEAMEFRTEDVDLRTQGFTTDGHVTCAIERVVFRAKNASYFFSSGPHLTRYSDIVSDIPSGSISTHIYFFIYSYLFIYLSYAYECI